MRGLRYGDCVEHDVPRWVQLLQEVKVNHVTGQHRTSVLSSRFKEQRIIQHATALLSSVSLDPGQHARQYSRFPPYLSVRCDRPVAGVPVDDRSHLLDDFSRPGVIRVEQATGRRQFALRDRAMPCFARSERRFPVLAESVLEECRYRPSYRKAVWRAAVLWLR